MPYKAADPTSFVGKVVADGHCVAFVKAAAGAPQTSAWKRGQQVKGASIAKGAAVATFDASGTYANATNGSSHAAIYDGQDASGLFVYDQWNGQPVHRRLIRFRSGAGTANNNGDAYFVVGPR